MVFFNKVCYCNNKAHEVSVKDNQSIPIAKMNEMRASGRAIAASSMENQAYFDTAQGVIKLENMPLEYVRGIDDNMLFEASLRARQKIKTWRENQAKKQKHDVGSNGAVNG